MFQSKSEWSSNRSPTFIKRKEMQHSNIAWGTNAKFVASCKSFCFLFQINNEEASSVCFPDIIAREHFFSCRLAVARGDIKQFALIIIKDYLPSKQVIDSTV